MNLRRTRIGAAPTELAATCGTFAYKHGAPSGAWIRSGAAGFSGAHPAVVGALAANRNFETRILETRKKAEDRIPKPIRESDTKRGRDRTRPVTLVRPSDFGFLSDFGFRISDLRCYCPATAPSVNFPGNPFIATPSCRSHFNPLCFAAPSRSMSSLARSLSQISASSMARTNVHGYALLRASHVWPT